MHPREYSRIIVLGNNGSGKSCFARQLAAITGLPLIHLDLEYWRPGWQAPPGDEWRRRQAELVAGERWIIDGMHSDTLELRFRAAELVILLDVNRLTCLAGVLARRGKARPDMPDFLEDKLDAALLKGLWRYPGTRRRAVLALHESDPDKPFRIIRGRREMNRLLRRWSEESAKKTAS